MTSDRGFTLVELLVALAIVSVLGAGVAAVVPPSRLVFEQTPAALDAQHRGRAAAEALAQPLRTAGLPGFVPPVLGRLPHPDGHGFQALLAIVRRANAAQGTLAVNQAGASGALVLAGASCPEVDEVCGFTTGATAVIADGAGRFDLFSVSEVGAGTHSLRSSAAFSAPYAAGAIVVEVDAHTFRLDVQPDGSTTLVRETTAGVTQPIVDRVRALLFSMGEARVEVSFIVDPVPGVAGPYAPTPRAYRFAVHVRNGS